MTRLTDLAAEASTVALLDPEVLSDLAAALSGSWRPSAEADATRRGELLAAALLRLYAEHERGWFLVATTIGHRPLPADEATAWSAGFIPPLDSFEDAPTPSDVTGLAGLLERDDGLDPGRADTLALAVLCDPVSLLVTREPRAYRHQRTHDVPGRLEIVDAAAAVARLGLAPGTMPFAPPAPGTALAEGEPWWVP